MKSVELKNSFENGHSALYFLYGDDSYVLGRCLKEFQSLLSIDFLDFNLRIFSDYPGVKGILDAVEMLPTFDSLTVTIVKALPEKLNEADVKQLGTMFKAMPPDSVLVIVDEKKLLSQYHKLGVPVECSHLDRDGIMQEIGKLLVDAPYRKMKYAAVDALIANTGGDMMRIVNEMAKLKAYSSETITAEDVNELVKPDFEAQIYELSNALVDGKKDQALKVVDSLKKSGIRGAAIISTLTTQYRRLLHCAVSSLSDEELATVLGMSAKAVYVNKKISAKYKQTKLKFIVDYLGDMSIKVLSGAITEDIALDTIVLKLLAQ